MSDRKVFPLWIRDETPDKEREWIRLTADGGRDGFHTGGAWLNPESDLVYKPLDARPYANCDVHVATNELEANIAMSTITGFRNWWTETTSHAKNGETVERQWIVRKRALTDWNMSRDEILQVEQIVRQFNEQWWEIGDSISVAKSIQTGDVFILDLSCACYRPNAQGCYIPNDWWRVEAWLKKIGAVDLARLRRNGDKVLPLYCGDIFFDRRLDETEWPGKEWVHVYASRFRPVNEGINKAHYVNSDYGETGVYSWVVTPEKLNDDTLLRYQLEWAWSPLEHKELNNVETA